MEKTVFQGQVLAFDLGAVASFCGATQWGRGSVSRSAAVSPDPGAGCRGKPTEAFPPGALPGRGSFGRVGVAGPGDGWALEKNFSLLLGAWPARASLLEWRSRPCWCPPPEPHDIDFRLFLHLDSLPESGSL